VGVQFSIDANGIFHVLARDTTTQRDVILEIQNTAVDVADEKVERMISESIDHAFEDMNERIWTEARLKAEELLPAVDQALDQLGAELSSEEVHLIQTCAAQVKNLLRAPEHDVKALKAATQTLDEATQQLAVMLVDKAMEESLQRRGIL
jgi:molecular chaperone DnaK